MPVRRKRALLAGIEGQLAVMKDDDVMQRRWQRVRRAIDVLRSLPRDDFETARFMELQRQITAVLKSPENRCAWLREQRLTLARADCIIWQMHLRRFPAIPVASPGVQWPPHVWTMPDSDPTVAVSAAAAAV